MPYVGRKRSRPVSRMPGSPIKDCGKRRSRAESEAHGHTSGADGCGSSTLNAHIDISNSYPSKEQTDEETGDQLLHAHSSSGFVDEDQETVITTIRATDMALGLRRLPAGFYTVVQYSDSEWRTECKRSSFSDDVVEWSGQIPIPSDLSATIRLEVYSTFEFQPILGAGEQLRKFTTTVEQLLERSANGIAFVFFQGDEDVVSPCSSILVTVERRKRESIPSASRLLGTHRSSTEPRGELDNTTNNGHAALLLHQMRGERGDLERSIQYFEHALVICPLDHPCRAAVQSNLAMSKLIRGQVENEDASLEHPLLLYRNALVTRPVGHPDRPSTLIQLAAVHLAQFQRWGNQDEKAQAEALLREAMELCPIESHENRVVIFMLQLHAGRRIDPMHATSQPSLEQDSTSLFIDDDVWISIDRLLNLFLQFGQLADLQSAIAILESLVESPSISNDWRRAGMMNLGIALMYRFEHLGELSDLENAILKQRDAVHLTPRDHPDTPTLLSNLGESLRIRFKRLGTLSNLEDAISILGDAVNLTLHGHPQKPSRLNNLAISLEERFDRLGQLSDLEDSILMLKDAVDLTPRSHPKMPHYLNNLGISFKTRFRCLGQLSDLEDAISMLRIAVDLTPHNHTDKPDYLNNLGSFFRARFDRLGKLSDLEDAISRQRDAVNLTPHGHPGKPSRLNNLGNSFATRFRHLGQLDDLENAISRHGEAIELTPPGHPAKPRRLDNLGNSLTLRFECLGELNDIKGAISILRDAVDLTPRGHPDKPNRLNNLGASFFARFERFGQLSDLEDAMSRQMDALDLTADDHPWKHNYLNNLGLSFFTRFKSLRQLSDLEDAIMMQRDAVDLIPHGHPNKLNCLNNLGISLMTRFEHLRELSNLEQAISLYSHVASAPIGSIDVRFDALQNWLSCARRIRHHSLLHACSVAVDQLPQLAWIGLSLTDRYSKLTRGADVVREAAAVALDLEYPEAAVEWLEQGRSIVWGELLQLRSSYEELSSAHPDRARRLGELSTALDHVSAAREKSLFTLSEQRQTTESSQHEADMHRALAIERDKLLHEIRRLPGFEQFLLRKAFSRLRALAHSGPVVILNAAATRCDALIVLADVDHVIHIPLPKFSFERATDLRKNLKGYVRHVRDGQRAIGDAIGWESILPPLWKSVVKPILDALAISTPGDLTRIFWCPTGPFAFLPIHAAGLYDLQYSEPGNKVFDLVVSSYVPTLSILALPPSPVPVHSDDLCLLVVPQPPSDGQARLPGVTIELDYIREVIRSSPSTPTVLMESSTGTVEEVLSLMKQADWVHFACHGIQDVVDSGLHLADGRRLTLRDIMALSRPRGGLAFLSACQTATGEERLSDEAIHIAAGMLFAGYGGVVGSMWSISDRIAPIVARDVYEYLFRDGKRPDYRDAARALHEAIGELRERDVSFTEWVPFIHVGL